jgi:hypothetical protein
VQVAQQVQLFPPLLFLLILFSVISISEGASSLGKIISGAILTFGCCTLTGFASSACFTTKAISSFVVSSSHGGCSVSVSEKLLPFLLLFTGTGSGYFFFCAFFF